MKEQILTKANQVGASNFLAIIAAFLAPIKSLIIIVGICIAADTLMGLWKAKKTKTKITSRKLSTVISKMFLYQGAIVLFFCIEKYILADFVGYFVDIELFFTKLVASILIFIELMSMNENYIAISGVSIWGKFKEMIRRAKEVKEEIKDLAGDDAIGSEGSTEKSDK